MNKMLLTLFFSTAFVWITEAAVYLKPLAADETRQTIDGASWQSAYTDLASAVSAAQDGDAIYAAAGVYVVGAKITLNKSLTILGGFRGEEGETAEERDPIANETIFTGDVNLDDVYYHYEINPRNNTLTATRLDACPVIADGRIQLPPAYTGDYDCYAIAHDATAALKTSDNTEALFAVTDKEASFSVDGVVFSGFYSKRLNGNIISSDNYHKALLSISRCRFHAYASYEGSIWTGNASVFTLSDSRFSCAYSFRNAGVNIRTGAAISRCAFESIYGVGPVRANALFFGAGNAASTVEETTFTRVAKRDYINDNYGGPAAVVGGEQASSRKLFRFCVISNCFAGVTSLTPQGAMPILSPNVGLWVFERCRFSRNAGTCRTVNGRTYTLFGVQSNRSTGDAFFNGCVFDGNTIVSTYTSATIDYALGICGSGAAGADATFLNCVFDRNHAEALVAADTVPAVCAQGVLAGATIGAAKYAIANCTFRSSGAPGVVDVAQYGSQHASPIPVVNSLFMTESAVSQPFYSQTGASADKGIVVYDSTAQNVFEAQADIVNGGGWAYDAVPFDLSADGVLTPSAKTPQLREARNVAVKDYASGTAMPELLIGEAASSGEFALIGDIVGDAARPSGGFTRGAKQALSVTAENGVSLVLRRTPFAAGTFEGVSAQSVPTGGAIVPVTAIPAEGATFLGWYTEEGECHSTAAKLEIESLSADTVLTARFSTKVVSLTFNLGDGGTFDDNNLSTIVLHVHAGEEFPKLPSYSPSPDWIVTGFGGEFPEVVPDDDAVYTAELLTTAVRVFHIVPLGEVPDGSDRTGSSWENATDDIAAAIADATRYRGELWLKEGVYDISSTLDIRSNVGLYGGFAGNETERNQADSLARPTVLTGDTDRNDYYRPDGIDPPAADRNAVFDYDARRFNPPPRQEGEYSRSSSGSNTAIAFSSYRVGMATNVVFSGLNFVSFGKSAIYSGSTALRSEIRVEKCSFYACGYSSTQSATVHSYGSVQMEDCSFHACRTGVIIGWGGTSPAVGESSLVNRCLFEDCEGYSVPLLWLANNTGDITVRNCVFRRNRVTGYSASSDDSLVMIATVQTTASVRLEDCLFENNGNCKIGGDVQSNGQMVSLVELTGAAKIDRCRFIGNTNTVADEAVNRAGIFHIKQYNVSPVVRDSYFAANALSAPDSAAATYAAIALAEQGIVQFFNCTFGDNAVTAPGGRVAGLVAGAQDLTGFVLAHSTFFNNRCTGVDAAEIVQLKGTVTPPASSPLTVINSVLFNESAQYAALSVRENAPVIAVASHISNAQSGGVNATVAHSLWRDVSADDPRLKTLRDNGAGVYAIGLSASSPLARKASPLWLAGNHLYFYDPVTNPDKPWRSTKASDYYAASVAGITLDSPILPDAFGEPRVFGSIGAGPLAVPPLGFEILIR